jgi:hypothetical protein
MIWRSALVRLALRCGRATQETEMPRYTLETIVIVLVILWLLGGFVFPLGGNLIHLLLVVILLVILFRVLRGRGPLG